MCKICTVLSLGNRLKKLNELTEVSRGMSGTDGVRLIQGPCSLQLSMSHSRNPHLISRKVYVIRNKHTHNHGTTYKKYKSQSPSDPFHSSHQLLTPKGHPCCHFLECRSLSTDVLLSFLFKKDGPSLKIESTTTSYFCQLTQCRFL